MERKLLKSVEVLVAKTTLDEERSKAQNSARKLSEKTKNVGPTVANPHGIFIDEKVFDARKEEVDSAREKQAKAKALRLAKAAEKQKKTSSKATRM